MSRTVTMAASELVIDFDLYPRHHIDSSNTRSIMEAIDAGETLPPIIADAASKRVVDGVHRTTAALRKDPDARVKVTLVEYADDGEMFLDAVRRNARHGVKLNNYDRARVLNIGDRLGVDEAAVAGALAVDVDVTAKLRAARTAYGSDGRPVEIKPRAAKHLAGTKLSEKQERAVRRSQGWPLYFHCDQIINAIEGDLVDWSDERNTEAIDRLRAALSEALVAA